MSHQMEEMGTVGWKAVQCLGTAESVAFALEKIKNSGHQEQWPGNIGIEKLKNLNTANAGGHAGHGRVKASGKFALKKVKILHIKSRDPATSALQNL